MPAKPALSDEQIEQLIDAARDAATCAYAPYSKFTVGAALLTEDGTVVSGCNVENASYGLTICAERNALWKAVSEGHQRVVALAVFTPTETPTPPCGACRQVAHEFGPDMTVVCAGLNSHVVHTLRALLPGAFGPADLRT